MSYKMYKILLRTAQFLSILTISLVGGYHYYEWQYYVIFLAIIGVIVTSNVSSAISEWEK